MNKLRAVKKKLASLSAKTNTQRSNFLKKFFYFFLTIFLFANIFFSQRLPNFFLAVFNLNENAVFFFLEKIKNTPYFSKQLDFFSDFFPLERLKNQVFSKDIEREKNIEKYKKILEKNPHSTTALYNLYLLYQEKNEKDKADYYHQRLFSLDPERK